MTVLFSILFYVYVPILAFLLLAYLAINISKKSMTPASTKIWRIGLVSIFILNLLGALPIPFKHKGSLSPVGENVVSVYRHSRPDDQTPIPIRDWVPGKTENIQTDQQVLVFMHNSYIDKLIGLFPKISILVFALTAFISWLASIMAKSRNGAV